MSRHIRLTCPPAPSWSRERDGSIHETFTIELVTPLFGGGVEAGCNDPITAIRPSSIRGQLRFWWRATVGARLGNLRQLRQREGEIWGTTAKASRVGITVTLLDCSDPVPCLKYGWDPRKPSGQGGHNILWLPPFDRESPLPYVLFPFRGKLPQDDGGILKEQVNPASRVDRAVFQLTAQYPSDLRLDVHLSLWAWVNFGGIGARTRRGCGALFCKEFAPENGSREMLDVWLRRYYGKFTDGDLIPEIPSLQYGPLVLSNELEPVLAWEATVASFQSFRQEGIGRKRRPFLDQRLSASNLPGRSHWPEPETIRGLQNTRTRKHQPLKDHPKAFPRAEFGLPIIFHFKDDKVGDPKECELYPNQPYETGRMASPLILKPLATGVGRNALPMIVRLSTPRLTQVRLKKSSGDPVFGEEQIRDPKLCDYPNSPLEGRSSDGSALEAFMTYARQNGFREVGL